MHRLDGPESANTLPLAGTCILLATCSNRVVALLRICKTFAVRQAEGRHVPLIGAALPRVRQMGNV